MAICIGNLGSDISLRYTQDGKAVGNANIAVTEKYKDQEKTEWVRLVFWGKSAEIVEKYAGKGSSLFVSGRLQTRSWDKDGHTHYATEVVVSNFQFLGGAQNSSGSNQNHRGYGNQGGAQSQNRKPGPGSDQDYQGDIPF